MSNNIGNHQNQNEESLIWSISDDLDIPSLPRLYPLEKTHVIINDAAPSLIVNRIALSLKQHSIECTVNNNSFSAKATTSCYVSFIIRLHSVSNPIGTLVEIQRLSGCGFTFHRTCKNLLKAAKGIPAIYSKNPNLKRKSLSAIPVPRLTRKPRPAPKINENIQESLEIVESLLKKDRIDANLLGIESLRMLTNPEITSHESALFAANIVLNGTDQSKDIMEKVQMLVQHWRLCEDDMEEEEYVFDKRHYSKMHNHALAALANSLQLCSLHSGASIDNSWFGDDFISSLIHDLNESYSKPHDGVLSLQCLKFLTRNSESVREMAMNKGVEEALQRTLSFGACANDILAKESEQACLALKCSC